jgi:hypothetical protein
MDKMGMAHLAEWRFAGLCISIAIYYPFFAGLDGCSRINARMREISLELLWFLDLLVYASSFARRNLGDSQSILPSNTIGHSDEQATSVADYFNVTCIGRADSLSNL